jgi:hypothetical protein
VSTTGLIDSHRQTATRRHLSADRLGGLGGLVFVGMLIVQNALRAKAPGFNASPEKVTSYFIGHRAAVLVPLGMFPIEMLALFAFVAALGSRTHDDTPWLATVGGLGATAIASLFAIVNITEIVLAAKAHQLAATPGTVQALWTTHAAAFGLDLAAIAVTLVGLSQAAAANGLIPAWVRVLVVPGAAFLFVTSTFTVSLANGGPWLALALVGFVVWAIFVVAASISLLRRGSTR